MDWEAVRRTSEEAVAAMLAMPYEPSRNFKSLWPCMWCEWASIGIAEALEARGFGEWRFVQARLPDDPGGHAWLEHRDADGELDYSIDATLQQFGRYGDEPYYGPDRTPAAADFTEIRFEGPWREWRVIERVPQYIEFVAATLQQMGEPGDA